MEHHKSIQAHHTIRSQTHETWTGLQAYPYTVINGKRTDRRSSVKRRAKTRLAGALAGQSRKPSANGVTTTNKRPSANVAVHNAAKQPVSETETLIKSRSLQTTSKALFQDKQPSTMADDNDDIPDPMECPADLELTDLPYQELKQGLGIRLAETRVQRVLTNAIGDKVRFNEPKNEMGMLIMGKVFTKARAIRDESDSNRINERGAFDGAYRELLQEFATAGRRAVAKPTKRDLDIAWGIFCGFNHDDGENNGNPELMVLSQDYAEARSGNAVYSGSELEVMLEIIENYFLHKKANDKIKRSSGHGWKEPIVYMVNDHLRAYTQIPPIVATPYFRDVQSNIDQRRNNTRQVYIEEPVERCKTYTDFFDNLVAERKKLMKTQRDAMDDDGNIVAPPPLIQNAPEAEQERTRLFHIPTNVELMIEALSLEEVQNIMVESVRRLDRADVGDGAKVQACIDSRPEAVEACVKYLIKTDRDNVFVMPRLLTAPAPRAPAAEAPALAPGFGDDLNDLADPNAEDDGDDDDDDDENPDDNNNQGRGRASLPTTPRVSGRRRRRSETPQPEPDKKKKADNSRSRRKNQKK